MKSYIFRGTFQVHASGEKTRASIPILAHDNGAALARLQDTHRILSLDSVDVVDDDGSAAEVSGADFGRDAGLSHQGG